MKARIVQISVILVTLVLSSCFDPPIFPDEPVIKYRSLRYINYPDGQAGVRDSLILRFDFEDGDGNIGLDDRFSVFQTFQPFNCVIDSRDSMVTISDTALVPPLYVINALGERVLYSEDTQLPKYNECDYKIVSSETHNFLCKENAEVSDTVLVVDNEYSRNFYIDFYRKKNGQYTKIDFQKVFGSDKCEQLTFDARIPVFNDEGQGKSMSGTINYDLRSSLWELALSTDTFKIEFFIYDRALQKSNVEESPDLTLPRIMVNKN